MFLQKQRKLTNLNQLSSSSTHSTKLQNFLKYASIPEIKSHKKHNPYLNERELIIANTEQLLKRENKQYFREETLNSSKLITQQRAQSRQSQRNEREGLSRRESRVIAARRYRQRIGKRLDIGPLIKAQEELEFSRRTEMTNFVFNQSTQRVQRYKDMLKEFSSQFQDQKKELAKTYWLAGAIKRNVERRMSMHKKNPQIPVTNIKFQMQDSSWQSKGLSDREKRRDAIKRGNLSYSSQVRRVNRVVYSNAHHDDNFIEPW